MASIVFFLLLSFSLLSAGKPLPKSTIFRPRLTSDPTTTNDISPTTYFEVTKPIQLPNTKPYSKLVLQHDFGYTYGSPPVLAEYTPPANYPSNDFAKIVLEWTATCKGRQFDRIFGVWLGGVELLRSCTAEPRATGIVWTVKKDITRYHSLLMNKQTLAVYLGNIVDDTYTGVYHVNVTVHFYPAEKKMKMPVNSDHLHNQWADLIIPISRSLPLDDGLWFEIENSTDVKSKKFVIPQNAYRALLEVYVSFHENDEFWPTNVPNEYISANNLTGFPGNGPFREVGVSLDGNVVGAIWPFTVVYTGGVNPLLWRPITGIGSFDLPSYDIEITPFLGSILDGESHDFAFRVRNALNVWYIDANLHVWLDGKSEKTNGKFLMQKISPLHVSLESNFTGLNGTFVTKVNRSIKSSGWVQSSFGKIVTESTQEFDYSNFMVMRKDGDSQIVNQMINFNDSVYAKMPSSVLSKKSLKSFSFYIFSDTVEKGKGSYSEIANITLGFNEKKIDDLGSKSSSSVLENLQNGQGSMLVKGNLVVSGLGSTQQMYNYGDDKFCYFRDISSSNYTIIYDKEGSTCSKRKKSRFDFAMGKRWPFPARRALKASDRHAM
ncbi:peptide-N4-(N-acetyl-beta-glucosaminyl)asparagine amidase A [Cynara cardunculus var. scolymus]|uniref:Peptide-N4-(N-acetyl-beta-glucosaminyl)asparagine amidase A n=1 Tax=Cynara cardunculus var. scolymus TaxID=59895 RepID=A0A118K111_CYNCS|nr:peptide-N4-(N-acetyl-beta-glucosaminyl)asparagine amidase A [Cynara cardunculus var. scolymus]KVI02158.1 Peptide-N4-(N-acetyl-beta-glucosaminyl)asparagine amidase A [Cynara cardunculus var. scolymus]